MFSDNFCCCAAVHEEHAMTIPDAAALNSDETIGRAPTLLQRTSAIARKKDPKEQARLLVNEFIRKALRGCACTHIQEGTGLRVSTQYRVDRSLKSLVVVPAPRLEEVTCVFDRIEDIFSVHDDGQDRFPTEVLSALKPGEMELLLKLCFRDDKGRLLSFYLVEQSADTRDAFMESLRILCVYGQLGGGAAA